MIVALVFASWLSGPNRGDEYARHGGYAATRMPHPTVWVAALLVPFVDYLLHQQGALMLATVLATSATGPGIFGVPSVLAQAHRDAGRLEFCEPEMIAGRRRDSAASGPDRGSAFGEP